MNVLRLLAGVLVGYLTCAVAATAWVATWHREEAPGEGLGLVIATTVVLAISGLLGGRLLARLAGPRADLGVYLVASLLVLGGLFVIATDSGIEPAWHSLLVIVVQAPAVLIGSRSSAPSPGRDADA